MITSHNIRDFIDAKLREMREVHPGWACLKAEGSFFETSDAPEVQWQAYASEGAFSPMLATAEETVEWFKDHRAHSVKRLREEAQALNDKAAELLRKAEQLESKTP